MITSAPSSPEHLPEVIPISLCFDVEPDERCINPNRRAPWSGFEDLFGQIRLRRKLLEEAVGSPARFCWTLRLDPQIELTYGSADWVVKEYRSILDQLIAEGDEIGIHTHAWRWDTDSQKWIGEHENDAWVEHCVRLSCETYEKCFGQSARVFRFGDRFMSNKVMRILEELGIVCDLTPEPGHIAVRRLAAGELTTGWIPDYRTVPRSPYQPSRFDFCKPARFIPQKIWILPLSTGYVEDGNDGSENLTMVMGFPFEAVRQVLEQNLMSDARPYIVAVARTDVTLDPFTRGQFDLFLDHLAEHPLRRRFRFTTPLETLRLLNKRFKG
jgi:hypothetical protein